MSRFAKAAGLLTVLAVTVLASVGIVLAGSDTHIFGLVFVDTNLNGVWEAGEMGFEGATITMMAGNEEDAISLESAGTRELEEGESDLCTYQDFTMPDSDDDDDEVDVNPSPSRPCVGSWGLYPAGETEAVWRVELTPPAGYMVTSPNPQYITVGTGPATVDFGIAPAGAGGPVAASIPILPVTGAVLGGVIAALLLIGGAAVLTSRKLHE